jgi:zinc and cadmium transporter
MLEIIIFSFVVMLASLVGVLSVWKHAGVFIERHLRFLVSFSAGVFLIIAFNLGIEVIEHGSDLHTSLLWIGAGALGIWIIFKLIPSFHHHHDEHEEDHAHSSIDARRILTGDAIHNIGDGILLAAAFTISTTFGAITALSIFIHELVQEVSEFFVLKQAGYSTKKALILNFLISGTILIGALGSFFLVESFEVLEIPLLGIAAGSFLVIILYDLVPHSVRTSKTKTHYLLHLLWFLIGVVLMLGVNLAVGGHTHEEEHVEDSSPHLPS